MPELLVQIAGVVLSALLGGGGVTLYKRTLGRPKRERAHADYKKLIRKREALTVRIAAAKAEAMKGKP